MKRRRKSPWRVFAEELVRSAEQSDWSGKMPKVKDVEYMAKEYHNFLIGYAKGYVKKEFNFLMNIFTMKDERWR